MGQLALGVGPTLGSVSRVRGVHSTPLVQPERVEERDVVHLSSGTTVDSLPHGLVKGPAVVELLLPNRHPASVSEDLRYWRQLGFCFLRIQPW